MYYKKVKARGYLIEYIYSLSMNGNHIVYINNVKVPKRFSFKNLKFLFIDDNAKIEIIANSVPPFHLKRNIDIYFDDEKIASDLSPILKFGTKNLIKESEHKKKALEFLKVYDIDDSLHHFQQALSENKYDMDIHFHLACCYSLMEKKKETLHHISLYRKAFKSSEYRIKREDKLAWFRILDE